MNEIKSLEHATLKVPYEVFNKRYRNAQRVLDVEARQVATSVSDIDTATKKGANSGEIDTLLGGMVEKLTTMKRKASEAITEEVQAAFVCKKRLEHLKEQADALADPSAPQAKTQMNQWRKVRLDRMLVDYFLRNGYYDSANKLADVRGLRDLTNVDIYAAAAEVEAELAARRTARCLQWCADNRSKLRKLNSTMEFKIRIQTWSPTARCWAAGAGARWWRSSAGSTRASCTPRACPRCPWRCSSASPRSTRRSATARARRCRRARRASRRSTRWRARCRTRTARTRASCAACRACRSTSTTSPWCCPTDRSTARRR
ncbi:E3 ubiquitin-protein transferase MAEA isoform X2 [Vanessa atalanta]|uniref:E3 ubiquitin-protein transferase MAEA isoform X2 n=1 Tax=Vanessa atalanta TaxID=42275 RepID=UPI001FCD7DC3|nr:E3 ubiquitin-protein transferase MAEA isoform X2 [Vanessa atalanta]